MSGPITIVVPGRPVPKGRPRFSGRGRRPHTPPKTAAAERKIALIARIAGARPINGPVSVRAIFIFADRRTRGDVDNLSKLALDALNGIAFKDDRQVVRLYATIAEGPKPFTAITITPVTKETPWAT